MSTHALNQETTIIADAPLLYRPPNELIPYAGNARTHDEKQLAALMASVREFGFTGVIVTNEEGMVLAGNGRLEAAKRLGLKTVPTPIVAGLTKAQQRAYVLADNKISQMSKWDSVQLKTEIEFLIEQEFEIGVTGFSTAEIDIMIDGPSTPDSVNEDDIQPKDVVEQPIISRLGDLYVLGHHRLFCGDALQMDSYVHVMNGAVAQMVITDPPYNVKIDGHVCGNGSTKHDEFAMASGEMDEGEFTSFLETSFALMQQFSQDGAVDAQRASLVRPV
jgi:hypothetical protein